MKSGSKILNSVSVLGIICLVTACLLGAVNALTSPYLERAQQQAEQEGLREVYPRDVTFTLLEDLSSLGLPSTVETVYRAKDGGYVFRLVTAGYAGGLTLLCGVDPEGAILGAVCLSSGETLGYEKTYGERFVGATPDTVDAVETVSGATKTTTAYRDAMKDALNAFRILSGEEVDLRSEEEILQENLAAALPAADGDFSRWFRIEPLTAAEEVYLADNGRGMVLVAENGGIFAAFDEDGTPLSSLPEELATALTADARTVCTAKTTVLDLSSAQGLSKWVETVERTDSGIYVFSLKAAGYGIKGGSAYHPASGVFIRMRVAVTADGRILDCETVSQEETEGVGSACASRDFTGQFADKTEATLDEVDAIAGATVTTNGYLEAVYGMFDSLKVLEGGKVP